MKAILVIDMPEDCRECPVQSCVFCQAKDGGKSICDIKIKPDWCPLKPMPKKQALNGGLTEFQMGARSGYNLCIDEILGDKE